jgi:hypothetical protein
MPYTETLADRVNSLRHQALDLRAVVDNEALRARLDEALSELERIPELFPERLARQALLVPAGRMQTVRDIVGDRPILRVSR